MSSRTISVDTLALFSLDKMALQRGARILNICIKTKVMYLLNGEGFRTLVMVA